MFLLPSRIRRLIEKSKGEKARPFAQTSVLVELAPWDQLSFREQEVVALLYMRYSNEEMAGILSVTHATIKSHLDHIYKKLDVHSKKEVRLLFGDWPFHDWWDANHYK